MIIVHSFDVGRVTDMTAYLKVGDEVYQLQATVTFAKDEKLGRIAREFVRKWYTHSKTLGLPFGLEGDAARSFTADPIYSEAVTP